MENSENSYMLGVVRRSGAVPEAVRKKSPGTLLKIITEDIFECMIDENRNDADSV